MRLCYILACFAAVTAEQVNDKENRYEYFVEEIFEKYGNSNVLTYEGFEHLLENLGLGQLRFDESHDVSVHKINGSFIELHDEQNLHVHQHDEKSRRKKRHVAREPQGGSEKCLTTHEILGTFGLEPSHGLLISHAGFLHLCPAIVYELDQKHCWDHIPKQKPAGTRSRLYVWLEASISIAIMSVAGLLCAGVIPLLTRSRGDEFLQYLISMAAGTLLGDSLIHLLPQVLHHDELTEEHTAPLYRATLALFSMIAMFIIESGLKLKTSGCKQTPNEEEQNEFLDQPKEDPEKRHSHEHKGTLACAVISGDVLHNITDGLSIGAAFSSGQGVGLACAIAVFCHELPHELGDYAVLLRDGMGVKRAILFNLLSSVFSFIGMAAGILLGEVLHAAPWVNAFTAGTFIYIALVHLVPELKKSKTLGEVLCQTLGLTSGVTLMFFIGLYEDDFENFMAT